jgi:hypothetical protein
MKINIKNNSTDKPMKIQILRNFLVFCQEFSPLKKSINIVFVDRTDTPIYEGMYLIETKNYTPIELFNKISQIWVDEFSKQRKIPCTEKEVSVMSNTFISRNPNLNSIL